MQQSGVCLRSSRFRTGLPAAPAPARLVATAQGLGREVSALPPWQGQWAKGKPGENKGLFRGCHRKPPGWSQSPLASASRVAVRGASRLFQRPFRPPAARERSRRPTGPRRPMCI